MAQQGLVLIWLVGSTFAVSYMTMLTCPLGSKYLSLVKSRFGYFAMANLPFAFLSQVTWYSGNQLNLGSSGAALLCINGQYRCCQVSSLGFIWLLLAGFFGFVATKGDSGTASVLVVLGFHNQAFNWTTNAWQFWLTVQFLCLWHNGLSLWQRCLPINAALCDQIVQ